MKLTYVQTFTQNIITMDTMRDFKIFTISSNAMRSSVKLSNSV